MFEYVRDPKEMQRRARALIDGIQQGWLRMSSTKNFPLEQASAAHLAIEGRGTQGKLVLNPRSITRSERKDSSHITL
jgi:NADPH2:quinone reductase